MSCALWKREFISVLLFWITYMTSHFWLVVSRECTNIVIITLYILLLHVCSIFFSISICWFWLRPSTFTLSARFFARMYILKYTNDMIHFLEEPYTVTQFYYIVNRVFSIFWYTLVYKLLLFFFFSKRRRKLKVLNHDLEKMN